MAYCFRCCKILNEILTSVSSTIHLIHERLLQVKECGCAWRWIPAVELPSDGAGTDLDMLLPSLFGHDAMQAGGFQAPREKGGQAETQPLYNLFVALYSDEETSQQDLFLALGRLVLLTGRRSVNVLVNNYVGLVGKCKVQPIADECVQSKETDPYFDQIPELNTLHRMILSHSLRNTTSEIRARDFEREYRKFTAYKLHCATLTEYYKVERIPRGLRCNLFPTLFKDDTEFCKNFESILNKCSFDLILLTVETLQAKITETSNLLKSIEQQLSSSLPPDDWTKLKDKVDQTISEFRVETENKKRTKFLRDTEDYQQKRVYKWQDSNFQGYRQRRRSQRRSSSSSGDRSNDSRQRRFLGHGRPTPSYQHQDPQTQDTHDQRDEGARRKQPPPPKAQTRSQKK
ncbi:uncharacterized protein [Engystomops pustulosus]|uniref:uncharacterized protein n=1 Tax=Engystomops pustulosus TaxID=76066 RepID=UPI003AFA36F9